MVAIKYGAIALRPYEGERVIANISQLVAASRTAAVEVVYVQHDGEAGSELEVGSAAWEIYAPIGPRGSERVVNKRFNSAFRCTDLDDYLRARGVDTLIIVGMQTEYCVDTTCRVAFELGYRVVVPEMTNTTFDNGTWSGRQIYEHVNGSILADRFAEVCTMDEAVSVIRGGRG